MHEGFRRQPLLCLHTYPSLQWRDPSNPFFLRALALEEWVGILLRDLTSFFSIKLIRFVASPAGIPCPEGRRGPLWRINSRCWDRPNLLPLSKTHKLQMTKPPRKLIRTSGHLIRDLIKLSKVYPSPIFIKIACSWKSMPRIFLFFSSFSFCFSFFSPSFSSFYRYKCWFCNSEQASYFQACYIHCYYQIFILRLTTLC